MSVFQAYARYYDLLNAEKDYAAEVDYVEALLRRHHRLRSILELGCGTGIHSSLLAGRGYAVLGIDRSEEMLSLAAQRVRSLAEDERQRIDFALGDATRLRTGRKFDAVVLLFHVVSYQTTDENLKATMATARAHLDRGGLMLFDCWYGPAVLEQRPEIRTRHMQDESTSVTRLAEPEMIPDMNVVNVHFTVTVRDLHSAEEEVIRETHRMRYLFLPEIESLFDSAGFELVLAEEWLTGNQPGTNTWSLCVLGRAA